jgi:hypothetical protein
MSKDLLKKLKAGAAGNGEAESIKATEAPPVVTPVEPVEPSNDVHELPAAVKIQPVPKKRVAQQGRQVSGLTGFEELYNILKEEKQDFTFNKRTVYIDDDLADVLDLIKKEAKINSNLLASHLIKNFLLENIELIKALKKKQRGNKFLD